MYWSSGTTWNTFDITHAATAPLAAVGSGLTAFQGSSGTIHVYYCGSDSHIHELIWSSGTTWTTFDDTQAAGAPAAVTQSELTAFQGSSGNIHVYYFGSDLHIHELIWAGGTSWSTFDPTNAAGAPTGDANGTLTSLYSGGHIYLYYNDVAQQFHVLTWTSGTTWTNTVLSPTIDPQLQACGSGAASYADSQGIQVFHLGFVVCGGYNADNGMLNFAKVGANWATGSLPSPVGRSSATAAQHTPVVGFTFNGVDHVFFVRGYPNSLYSPPLDIVQWDGNAGAGWSFADLSQAAGVSTGLGFDPNSFSSNHPLTSVVD
jgi:hypothetical protein